jgi:hypothetical protein
MKNRLLLTLSLLCISFLSFAQNDQLFLHNGKKSEVTIIRNEQYTIIYKYVNENAEQTISRAAVYKIIYGKSGREEEISKKVIVNSESDWDKVQIFYDKAQTTGLTAGSEVKGKTAFINYNTGAGADRKAEEKIKKAAAAFGFPFVLITSEKESNYSGANGSMGLGSKQSLKKGIAFKY